MILLATTVMISVLYKGLIEAGFFRVAKVKDVRQLFFCLFEFLLLCAYWYYLYRFSKKCRHHSRSLRVYYIRTVFVFAGFNVVYWLVYYLLGRAAFLWIFRITVNLICVRLVSTTPKNLVPYMLAYLVITFLIMMLEPKISKAWRKLRIVLSG